MIPISTTRAHAISLHHTSEDDGTHTYRLFVGDQCDCWFNSSEELTLTRALLELLS